MLALILRRFLLIRLFTYATLRHYFAVNAIRHAMMSFRLCRVAMSCAHHMMFLIFTPFRARSAPCRLHVLFDADAMPRRLSAFVAAPILFFILFYAADAFYRYAADMILPPRCATPLRRQPPDCLRLFATYAPRWRCHADCCRLHAPLPLLRAMPDDMRYFLRARRCAVQSYELRIPASVDAL